MQIDRIWMIGGGLLQLVMGVMGATNSSLVGAEPNAVLAMNQMHGVAHAVAGAISMVIGVALAGRARADATIGYGVLFLIGFFVNLASPDLWGMMSDVPANVGVHVMHVTVAVASLLAGFVARNAPARMPADR